MEKKCYFSPSEFSKAPPCYWLAISDVQNIWNFLSPCKKIPYITRSTHVVEFFADCLTDFSPALYNPNSMIELPPNCPYSSPHLSWVIARGRGKHQDDRTIFPCWPISTVCEWNQLLALSNGQNVYMLTEKQKWCKSIGKTAHVSPYDNHKTKQADIHP